MPNKNYIAGRRKEYKIRDQYKKMGFDLVIRSSGSHTPIDLVAIDSKNKKIVLIQCKSKNMSEKKKQDLIFELIQYDGEYTVITKVE